MLDIHNHTPFETDVIPGIDKEGHDYATVLIKGTFDIANNQEALLISEQQVPVFHADELYGEPGESSIRYAADSSIFKPGCDVVLIGHAYTKSANRKAVDVSLQVGPLHKTVRVFGDRSWCKSMGTWAVTEPEPFEKMPLIYEKAFGGKDDSHSDASKHQIEQRNPVGIGFCVSGRTQMLEGLPLPNLEDPNAVINSWNDKPTPTGFGFIGCDWMPRIQYAGTYDESWLKGKCPQLPDDFDDHFFNNANPDLTSREYLKGGEPVKVVNVSLGGDLKFDLPQTRFEISMWIKGEKNEHTPNLDTVIIEPDEQRLVLVWRATVPCFREFLYIDKVMIKEV